MAVITRNTLKGILSHIFASGEDKRKDRAESLSVNTLNSRRNRRGEVYEVTATTASQDGERTYNQTVRHTGRGAYRWTCTCRDAIRGADVGPCKHTLAVATEGLNRITAVEERETLRAALDADAARIAKAMRDMEGRPRDEPFTMTVTGPADGPRVDPAASNLDDLF